MVHWRLCFLILFSMKHYFLCPIIFDSMCHINTRVAFDYGSSDSAYVVLLGFHTSLQLDKEHQVCNVCILHNSIMVMVRKFCFRFSFIFLNFILFFVILSELRASTLPFPLGLVRNSLCLCYFTWNFIIFLPVSEIDRLWPLLAKRLKAAFLAFRFFWVTSILYFLKKK